MFLHEEKCGKVCHAQAFCHAPGPASEARESMMDVGVETFEPLCERLSGEMRAMRQDGGVGQKSVDEAISFGQFLVKIDRIALDQIMTFKAAILTTVFATLLASEALAASCNGAFATGSRPEGQLGAGIFRTSADPGETFRFQVTGGSHAAPGEFSITQTSPTSRTLCSNETACNGLELVADIEGQYVFSIQSRSTSGASSYSASCTPNSTGPDEDDDGGGATGDNGDDTPSTGDLTSAQVGQRVQALMARLNAVRLRMLSDPAAFGLAIARDGADVTFGFSTEDLHSRGAVASSNPGDPSPVLAFSTDLAPESGLKSARIAGWVSGRVGILDDDSLDLDGSYFDTRIGLETRIFRSTHFGAFLSAYGAEVDSDVLATDIEDSRFGGGVYARTQIAPALTVGGGVSYEFGEIDTTVAGGTGSADVSRLLIGASLQGSFSVGDQVTIAPRAVLGYVRETRDSYTDSLGRAIAKENETDVTAALGIRVSRAYRFSTGTVEPFFDLSLDYLGGEDDRAVGAGRFVDDDTLSGGAAIGAVFELGNGMTLSGDIAAAGLGADTQSYSAGLRLVAPLN